MVTGFLFTAVRNWTGQPTPTGGWLAAIVALWLAARVAMLLPWPWLAALLNTAFPLVVAAGIAVPLARSGNWRNFFFVALLAGAAAATLAVHLSAMGVLPGPAGTVGLQAGLDAVLLIIAVIAGRVMPMFTNNAIAGAGAERNPFVERIALAGVVVLLACDLAAAPAAVVVPIALLAALANAWRLVLWRPWRTLRTPLVWVLHGAYAWIPVYLALRAVAAAGWIAPQFAIHALTVGAIGGMTIGMMTRTARGHTARALRADGWEVACYALVHAAAFVRVFVGMAWTSAYVGTIIASALFWSAAFGIYAIRYWPILTRPRLDGKPG